MNFTMPLAIVRRVGTGVFDDRNHETTADADVETLRGELQYKDAREMAQLNQAGAAVSDVTVWLPPRTDIRGSDLIRHEPDDGRRYEVLGIRPDPKGGSVYTRVDARLVTA